MTNETMILHLEQPEDGVAILWMDDPDASVNTLKQELVQEFDTKLTGLECSSDLEVLVFASGKEDNFVAGANLDMLQAVQTADDARELSETAQRMHQRIEALPATTVAAIHGSCLGGGLELALAFDSRIASTDKTTRLGLPEVRLGLLPGGGGTQRLPKLVGVERALDLLLTGRQLSASRALRAGLVDELVAKQVLIEAAIRRGRELRNTGPATGAHQYTKLAKNYLSFTKLRELVLVHNPIGRRVLFDQARKRTVKRTRGNYPAPTKILEAVQIGLTEGTEAGMAAEARGFGELVVSREAKQLIDIFFTTTELKKDRGGVDATVEEHDIAKIGVLGAGLMGGGISYVTVTKASTPVRLKDKDDHGVTAGLKYVRQLLDKRVKQGAMTHLERAQTLARITGTTDYSGFANTDLVIEAVFENLELKRQMVRDIESVTDPHTIFATNTSGIPVADIAEASAHPGTIIGMHYFSPVEKMPLLEVVVTPETEDWVTATCVDFGKKQGKTVIVVNDGPGFYTTRILGAYMNEAARVLSEGVPVERIDAALMDYGFPVGPMTLLDEVGIDVGQKVAETLHKAFGERMTPVQGMGKLLADGRKGRKNRRGIYRYGNRKRKESKQVDDTIYTVLGVTPDNDMSHNDIAERCTLQMINEAVYCLGEGILRNPRDGDIGAVFGLGFPPFRGGPFRYVDEVGPRYIVDRLGSLQRLHGLCFTPAPSLKSRAESGERFYDERKS